MSYELHGDTGTRLYRIWKSMKCRCNNPNHPTFKNYGARGVEVCEDWQKSYTAFKEWALSHGYSESLELDRTDVNKGYSPENCQWISHYEQTMNRRDTLYATIGNETTKLRDLCKKNGINIHTVNAWRHENILEDKLTSLFGQPVIITGGKKGVIRV